MILLLALLPLLITIGVLAILKKESRLILPIALIGSITPLLFVPILADQIGSTFTINWFSVNNLQFSVDAWLLPINFLLYLLVSIITPLVVLYSLGFMDKISENKRFYIQILSFAVAMLTFSLAANFILLFVAWEFLSITSYLLIGFWNQKESANSAARKTITIILLGDIALLGAIAILFVNYSTLNFSAIISHVASSGMTPSTLGALGLILIAVFTKSAQVPFQEWLADAMEGPTPVSAFLHSSTMVKAGVFLVMILFPLYAYSNLMGIIEIIGAITAIIGITNALSSTHIKKILAYSTVEELGLMLFALGMGAYSAAVYFFFAQTFYKALLFFYSGSLMKANGTEDIRQMQSAGRDKLLVGSALFGVLALAGFVPFNGFFGNIGLENSATNMYTYGFLLLIDLLVSLFIARWFFIPLKKPTSKIVGGKIATRYDLIPITMKIPIVLLAIMCLASSYFVSYVFGIAGSMSSGGYPASVSFAIGINQVIIESVLVILGIVIMYLVFYGKEHRDNPKLAFARQIIGNGALFEELYKYVAGFAYYIAGAFEFVDSEINAFFDEVGIATSGFGNIVRRLDTGLVNFYALVTIVGLIALIAYMVIL